MSIDYVTPAVRDYREMLARRPQFTPTAALALEWFRNRGAVVAANARAQSAFLRALRAAHTL